MKDKKILFMATADFAVGFLEDLVKEGYEIATVVTAPDKPAGRGRKLTPSPIKQKAEALGLPILQPERLSDESFLSAIQALNPDLGIVIAFRMLPEAVWGLPKQGTYNIHGSLLPRWRGAAPINHAIMAGDETTGVTLFKLRHELDAGDIVATAKLPIFECDTFGTIHDKLALLGRQLLLEKLPTLLNNELQTTPQALASDEPYATKLNRDNTQINWNQPARIVHNFIRGLSPHPVAWTRLTEENSDQRSFYKIYLTEVCEERVEKTHPGKITITAKKELLVGCADGEQIRILQIQAPGKKVLSVKDFLNGTTLPEDASFSN